MWFLWLIAVLLIQFFLKAMKEMFECFNIFLKKKEIYYIRV